MQHLVIHHVGHHKFRNHVAIKLAIDHDLLQCRVETAQQAAPNVPAPAQPRLIQFAAKIPEVQALEQ